MWPVWVPCDPRSCDQLGMPCFELHVMWPVHSAIWALMWAKCVMWLVWMSCDQCECHEISAWRKLVILFQQLELPVSFGVTGANEAKQLQCHSSRNCLTFFFPWYTCIWESIALKLHAQVCASGCHAPLDVTPSLTNEPSSWSISSILIVCVQPNEIQPNCVLLPWVTIG